MSTHLWGRGREEKSKGSALYTSVSLCKWRAERTGSHTEIHTSLHNVPEINEEERGRNHWERQILGGLGRRRRSLKKKERRWEREREKTSEWGSVRGGERNQAKWGRASEKDRLRKVKRQKEGWNKIQRGGVKKKEIDRETDQGKQREREREIRLNWGRQLTRQ